MHRDEHTWRFWGLSAGAHGLLLVLLMWGVSLRSQSPTPLEAELWSELPQLAAPVAHTPRLTPLPSPLTTEKQTESKADAEDMRPAAPDIVTQKNIAKKAAERANQERLRQERLAQEQRLKQEKAAAKEKLQKEQMRKEQIRQEQFQKEVQRITAMAGHGGSGRANANTGPRGDASWAARLATRVRSNTTFNAEGANGNPAVEYLVHLDPAGYIAKLDKVRSSGVPGFDEAVERAIYKSEPFPPDATGRVPHSFVHSHRPKDT